MKMSDYITCPEVRICDTGKHPRQSRFWGTDSLCLYVMLSNCVQFPWRLDLLQELLFVTVILGISWAALAADFAPALQWVKTTGGSGNTSVAAAAADARGNIRVPRGTIADCGSQQRAHFFEGSDSNRAHVFTGDSARGQPALRTRTDQCVRGSSATRSRRRPQRLTPATGA